MALNLLYILCFLITIVLLHFNINRYLHILQQSFYHVSEFFSAIKISRAYKVKSYDIVLFITMILSVVIDAVYLKYILVAFWILISLFAIKDTIINKKPEKKKFNITTRVKIIYICCYVILGIIFIPLFVINNIKVLGIVFSILSIYKISSMIIAICGNVFSLPFIKIGNYKYIKEAKDIIKKHKDLKIIGITGSYGKTSTKNIIASILSEKYSTVMTPQSYNTTLGVTKTIRENIKPYTEVFVCEMGASRIGDIKEICGIVKPDVSVITSIGPQHLSTIKSMENIIKEKFEIVRMAKEGALAVLNVDNQVIKENYLKYIDGKEVIKYGLDESTDCYAENIVMNEDGSEFDVVIGKERIKIETKLLGKHNIYNILCAIIIAKKLGLENDEIRKAVKKVKPIEHRLELKYMSGILALDDSFNSNPEGSKMAIECLTMFNDKYRVLVTPGMVELGSKEAELNKKLGNYATKCDFVILVGQNTTKDIKTGMDELNYKNYVVVKDINEAFEKLMNIKKEHENLIALIENDLPDCYL